MKEYRVWYRPYLLDDEEDYVVLEAENKDEARRRGNDYGWVTEIEEVSK